MNSALPPELRSQPTQQYQQASLASAAAAAAAVAVAETVVVPEAKTKTKTKIKKLSTRDVVDFLVAFGSGKTVREVRLTLREVRSMFLFVSRESLFLYFFNRRSLTFFLTFSLSISL
jgi:hypothetical protein